MIFTLTIKGTIWLDWYHSKPHRKLGYNRQRRSLRDITDAIYTIIEAGEGITRFPVYWSTPSETLEAFGKPSFKRLRRNGPIIPYREREFTIRLNALEPLEIATASLYIKLVFGKLSMLRSIVYRIGEEPNETNIVF